MCNYSVFGKTKHLIDEMQVFCSFFYTTYILQLNISDKTQSLQVKKNKIYVLK